MPASLTLLFTSMQQEKKPALIQDVPEDKISLKGRGDKPKTQGQGSRTMGPKTAAENLAEARRIVLKCLGTHPVRVYLFGSRARGEEGRASDIDIAILPLQPLPGWVSQQRSGAARGEPDPSEGGCCRSLDHGPGIPSAGPRRRCPVERTRERFGISALGSATFVDTEIIGSI